MKKPFFKLIIPVCISLVVVGVIFLVLKKTDTTKQGAPQAQTFTQRTGPWENPMDKREYWGDVKISEFAEGIRNRIYGENVEPNLIYMGLWRLGELGTTKSVEVMQEYLEINQRDLPAVAPSKEEMGDIKSRMSRSSPISPEGKVQAAIVHLIASGVPEGDSTAMSAVAEIKSKYQGTEYGDIFSEYLDKAVAQGKALAPINAEMRSKPILMR
ncbi:MAG: hypothetical protein LBV12_09975 [Puniceicoccales bacterium]|jgi:hypothetical protein|nr:hypothetical protein [Puniceicoccales bacterium]